MSNGFPVGLYRIRSSDTPEFPPGGQIEIVFDGADYTMTVDGGVPVTMETVGVVCLRSVSGPPFQFVCETRPQWIAGLLSQGLEETNGGGGQWTAEEEGGGVDPKG